MIIFLLGHCADIIIKLFADKFVALDKHFLASLSAPILIIVNNALDTFATITVPEYITTYFRFYLLWKDFIKILGSLFIKLLQCYIIIFIWFILEIKL